MTGEAEFNEVYFTDARIPDERAPRRARRRLARVAHDADERAGVDRRRRSREGLGRHRARSSRRGRTLPDERKDAGTLDEVMKLWIRAEVLRLTNIRANQNRKMGDPGPRGLDRQDGLGRPQQGHLRQGRRPDGRRGHALRQLRDGPARDRHGLRHARRRRSCAAGPTRSRAAPPR